MEHADTTGQARPAGPEPRRVLVTGASRGIGRAVALAFAGVGDRVAIHHRDSAEQARSVLAEAPGGDHVVFRADLADPEATRRMVDGAAAALGGLDVVVNNAGIYLPHEVSSGTYGQWREVWGTTLAVNLLGPANVIWSALAHMGKGGRIVNVSSRGAFRGEPDAPAYGASKAALNALSQSLAVALAPAGVAVTAVAPCFVDTDMTSDHLSGPRGPAVRAQSPFNRVALAEEVAAAVLWLASPEAEFCSGAILDINGASYLRT
ncbi:MAG: SDR family NAD(P)-dependent oxidoreductase [Acidimicrobiales bacterium]